MEDREAHELMELSHEPVEGYDRVFKIVMALASLYLAVILCFTL